SVRSTSLSFQAFCGITVLKAVSWFITSGTSPMVSAPTIFCISGANGTRVRSTLLPLAFSYPATTARKPTSSSRTKPWGHHTVTVVAAALAMKGRPRVPAAARPRDPRSTERLLSLLMPILLGSPRAANRVAVRVVVVLYERHASRTSVANIETLIRASTRLDPTILQQVASIAMQQCSHAEIPLANLGEPCVRPRDRCSRVDRVPRLKVDSP